MECPTHKKNSCHDDPNATDSKHFCTEVDGSEEEPVFPFCFPSDGGFEETYGSKGKCFECFRKIQKNIKTSFFLTKVDYDNLQDEN